jgi:hypothetical protein
MKKKICKARMLVKELVKKSFPELKWFKIFVFNFNFLFMKKNRAAVLGIPFVIIILVNKKTFAKELKGILAHELSHYALFIQYGFFKSFWIGFRYFISKKGKYFFERETEKETIKRGYARDLFIASKGRSMRNTNRKLKKVYSLGYMSPEEIKSYAKEIGKW